MKAFLCIAIASLVVVVVIGLFLDNYLDKKYGVSYDQYGNEIAHNTASCLLYIWCGAFLLAIFILNDLKLLS